MRTKALYFVLFLSFFFAIPVSAQVQRDIGMSQYKQPKKKREKVDFVEITANYYKKELNLDDFQAAAIREIIEKERDGIMELSEAKNISQTERTDRGNIITERIEGNILPLLSKEQADKFKSLQEKRKK